MAELANQILMRGLTASIPSAASSAVGAIYIETDLQKRVFRNSGTSWDLIAAMPSKSVTFIRQNDTASAAATNNAATTFTAVGDPLFRQFCDLRGFALCRLHGRIGAALVAATKLRVQYNPTSDPNIASGDAGWAELVTTAGSHTLDTPFLSAAATIPAAARVWPCLLRVGVYDGDGVVDPTITAAMLHVYAEDE